MFHPMLGSFHLLYSDPNFLDDRRFHWDIATIEIKSLKQLNPKNREIISLMARSQLNSPPIGKDLIPLLFVLGLLVIHEQRPKSQFPAIKLEFHHNFAGKAQYLPRGSY